MLTAALKQNLDTAPCPALSCGTSAFGPRSPQPGSAQLSPALWGRRSLPFHQENKIKRLLPQLLQVLAAPRPS